MRFIYVHFILTIIVTVMSRAVVGGFFTQGSYNELRKFVINYIHTIAFEGNQEERAYDICMRSKSIQG